MDYITGGSRPGVRRRPIAKPDRRPCSSSKRGTRSAWLVALIRHALIQGVQHNTPTYTPPRACTRAHTRVLLCCIGLRQHLNEATIKRCKKDKVPLCTLHEGSHPPHPHPHHPSHNEPSMNAARKQVRTAFAAFWLAKLHEFRSRRCAWS